MRQDKVIKFTITVNASGAYTSSIATAPGSDLLDGEGPWWLDAVEWVDGNLVDGVDAVLSVTSTPSGVDNTLLTLTNANADAWYYPRTVENGVDGAALLTRCRLLVYGTLKLVVSSGSAGSGGEAGAMWVYLTDSP